MRLRIRNKEDLKKAPRNAQGGLDLRRANLTEANLVGADLTGSDLSKADLWLADLRDALCRGANFTDADLSGATLWEADFREANLTKVDFRDVFFYGAKLAGADFTEAKLNWEAHHLVATVLEGAACGDKAKTAVANFVRANTLMCWKAYVLEGSFGELEYLKPWVISVLKRYDGFVDRVFGALEAVEK